MRTSCVKFWRGSMKLHALAALLLLFSTAGLAQPARERWNTLNALGAGSEVRVTLTEGKTVRGFFQKATAEAIVVNAATSQELLARGDVQRVQLKRPSHRGRNTLIGFGIGTAGGLTAGAAVDAKDHDFLPHAGKIVLGCFGAIVGTVVGVAWPTGRWHEIYRAP